MSGKTPWEEFVERMEKEGKQVKLPSTINAQSKADNAATQQEQTPWEKFVQRVQKEGKQVKLPSMMKSGAMASSQKPTLMQQMIDKQKQRSPSHWQMQQGKHGQTVQGITDAARELRETTQKYRQSYDAGRDVATVQAEYENAYAEAKRLSERAEKMRTAATQLRPVTAGGQQQIEAEAYARNTSRTADGYEELARKAEERARALAEELEYAKRFYQMDSFEGLPQREDYAEKAAEGEILYNQYREAKSEEFAKDRAATMQLALSDDTSLAGALSQKSVMSRLDKMNQYAADLSMLTEEEKQNYYYFLATDQGKALKYYDMVRQQKRDETLTKISEWAGKNFGTQMLASAGSVALLPYAFSDIFLTNEEYGNKYGVGFGEVRDTLRGGVAQKYNEQFGTIDESVPVLGGQGLGNLYQVGMSVADSAVAVATLGQYGTVLLAGAAASSAYNDAKKRGATEDQALLQGLASGVSEALFEYISIDRLLSQDVSESLIKNVLKQAGIEASEEAMTSLANEVSDRLIMQDKSTYEQAVQAYMQSGMTLEDAKRKAGRDFLNTVAQDAVGGFLSGGGMTLGNYVVQKVSGAKNSRKEGKGNRFTRDHSYDAYDQTKDFEIFRDDMYRRGMEMTEDELRERISAAEAIRDDESRDDKTREIAQYRLDGLARAWNERHENTAPEADVTGGTQNEEVFDDSSEWYEGMGTGGQAGIVEEGAGGSVAGSEKNTAGNSLQSLISSGAIEQTSAAEAGVTGGSTEKSLYIIPESEVAKNQQWVEIAEDAETYGAKVVLYAGDMNVIDTVTGRNAKVEGLHQVDEAGNVTIYVKADAKLRSAKQIYQHETFHDIVSSEISLMEDLAAELEKRYGRQEIARLVNDYIRAYNGIYGTVTENMSDAEADAIAMKYLEEVFADVYAKISRGRMRMSKARDVLERKRDAVEYAQKRRRMAENKNGPPIERTMYYSVEGAEEVRSIKEQLIKSAEQLNEMDPVADISVPKRNWGNKKENRKWAVDLLKATGYRVERQGFGTILFEEKQINGGLNYLNTPGEIAAYAAIPRVLKRGIEIETHEKHKGRIYDTVTFAAPVIINGERGNMAVVVKMTNANYYKMHRLLMPDGSAYELREAEPTPAGALSKTDTHATPISSASKKRVAQSKVDVKQKFSVEEETAELDAEYRRKMEEADEVIGEEADPAAELGDWELPEGMEDIYEQSVEKKKEQAEKSTMIGLKGRIKRSEGELKTQREALDHLKKAGWLTADVQERIQMKMKAIRDTLEIDRAELKRRNAERKKADREKRKEKEKKQIQEQRAKTAVRELRQDLLNLFSIKDGRKYELSQGIEQVADKMLRSGSVDNDTRRALFEALYENGEELVFDEYFKDISYAIRGGRIYVPESVRQEFGDDWNEIRKKAWGMRIYLTNNSTDAGIDVWTEDLRTTFPENFDAESDLRVQLENILDLAKEGMGQRMTLAEMMARNQDEYGWSVEEQMEELEGKVDRILETFAQKADLEIRLRQESIRKQISDHEYFRNVMESKREQRMDAEVRNRTMKQIQRLNKMRGKASPEQQREIAEALKNIDTVARSISPAGVENFQMLAQEYYETKDALGDNFLKNDYVEEQLRRLSGKTRVDDMSIEEVRDLGNTVLGIINSIQESNKTLATQRREYVGEMAAKAIEEISASTGSRDNRFRKYVLQHMDAKRLFDQLGGWTGGVMKRIGQMLSDGQEKMMHFQMNAMRIFDPFLKNKENQKWMKTATGKNAKWETIKVDGCYEVVGGHDVKVNAIELTPMMKVSLLMHSKNNDNLWHIGHFETDQGRRVLVGGLTLPNRAEYQKGNMKNAYARGRVVKMTPATVKAIARSCTAQEKSFADLLQKYFDGSAKNAINEVSMVLDGFERATMENYFPIQSDKAYIVQESELIKQDLAVASMGSLKARTHIAKNPIYLMDAADVLMRNIDQVSKYYGLALPIRDVNAVLNATYYKADRKKKLTREEINFGRDKSQEGWGALEGLEHMSVKKAIENKWGASTLEYIEKLLRDLQQMDRSGDMLSGLLSKLRGSYAKAVISFNPSSVLKQISSYPAAGTYLDFRALLAGLKPHKMKADVKTLEKYSAVYWYRNQGNATMELKDAVAKQSLGEKLPLGYGWTQRMDSAITRRLLQACEWQVQHDMGLAPGHQEDIDAGLDRYWTEVAKLFNTVVLNTQSNSSIMERPQITRANAGNISRFLTMFRTDAFQQFNVLTEASGRLRAAQKRYKDNKTAENKKALSKARKKAAKAYGSVFVAQLSVALITALIKRGTFKDEEYLDEEGEWDWNKFGVQLSKDVIEGFAGLIVGGETLVSAIGAKLDDDGKVYDINVNALEMINDALRFFDEFPDRMMDADLWRGRGVIKEGAQILAQIMGIPAKNVEKYLLSAVKWIVPEWAEKYENFWDETTKSDLSREHRDTADEAIGVILDNRTEGLSDEHKAEIARLYLAGGTGAVPGGLPAEIVYTNEDGEEIVTELNAVKRDEYREEWSEIVSAGMPDLLELEMYRSANDESKAALINKLYQFASDAVAHEMVPEKKMDKWVQAGLDAAESGVSIGEYIAFYVAMNDIDGKNSKGETVNGLHALRSLEYLQSMGWTDTQEEQVYRDLIASEEKLEQEAAFRKAGLSWEQTNDVINSLDSKSQQMATICKMSLSERAKANALKVIASDKQKPLIDAGVFFGVRMSDYATVLNNADTDGTGSVNQTEATEYIKGMGLQSQASAYLWQMVTDGKEGTNNPFSSVWGKEFYYEAHKNDPDEN